METAREEVGGDTRLRRCERPTGPRREPPAPAPRAGWRSTTTFKAAPTRRSPPQTTPAYCDDVSPSAEAAYARAARREQVWRKSKRVADDASGSKGSALASGAYSKRNRSALDDITNEYILLPEQPDRMVTRSSLRAAQAQAAQVVPPLSLCPCVPCRRPEAASSHAWRAQAACQGVPAAWKCPQPAGDFSDRSRGVAEQHLAAHSQQTVGPPTPRRLKKMEIESRATAPAVHVESWSQRWAAPRDTSIAMVLSPAEGSVGGISQRLSDRLGASRCCPRPVSSCSLLTEPLAIHTGVGTSPGVGYEPEDMPAVQPMEFEQDALHANNPQYCVDYVHEIFEHLIATENKLMPSSAYMDTVLSVLPQHFPPPSPAHMHTKCSIFQIVSHIRRGDAAARLGFPPSHVFRISSKTSSLCTVTLPAHSDGGLVCERCMGRKECGWRLHWGLSIILQ